MDPTVGAEIKKTKPAVIVNDDAIGVLPLKIIAPITTWKDRYAMAPWMVRVEPGGENGLAKTSAVDVFQIRSVSQARFVDRLGKLPEDLLREVTRALAVVLAIDIPGDFTERRNQISLPYIPIQSAIYAID